MEGNRSYLDQPRGRMPVRLVLIDDHLLFREGLSAVLAAAPDIEVVGEASDAHGAYEIVESAHPDVVLSGGSELVIATIRRTVGATPIVMIAEIDRIIRAWDLFGYGFSITQTAKIMRRKRCSVISLS